MPAEPFCENYFFSGAPGDKTAGINKAGSALTITYRDTTLIVWGRRYEDQTPSRVISVAHKRTGTIINRVVDKETNYDEMIADMMMNVYIIAQGNIFKKGRRDTFIQNHLIRS